MKKRVLLMAAFTVAQSSCADQLGKPKDLDFVDVSQLAALGDTSRSRTKLQMAAGLMAEYQANLDEITLNLDHQKKALKQTNLSAAEKSTIEDQIKSLEEECARQQRLLHPAEAQLKVGERSRFDASFYNGD